MAEPADPDRQRRHPDPDRPGTVYRSRPRWTRRSSDPLDVGLGRDRDRAAPVDPTLVAPQAPQARGYARGGYGSAPPSGPPQHPGARPGAWPGARPGPPPPPQRAGMRVRWRWVVAALVVLLLVYPLALFAVAWTSLRKVDALPDSGRPADTPGRTYLVVGSDSRQDLSRAERSRLGTGQAAGRRTDTIMLLHVPSGGGPTVLVSVPRDSFVAIPGRGRNKVNASYAFGGPQLLVRTVEQATGVRIDEYVETGLGGYARLVDAIGGVNVCVPRAIDDEKAHITLRKGCQTFDGRTALGYARARYSDPRGDLGRVERQRQVLAAIAGKTLSPSVVLLPWRSFPAARAGGDALTVDEGTSPIGLVQFVLAMRAVAGGGGLSLTVPVARTDLPTSSGAAVQWRESEADTLFEALRADDTERIRPLAQAQERQASR